MLITVGIMFLLWVLQILFFNVFYEKMKEGEIAKNAQTLSSYKYVDDLNNARYKMMLLDGIYSDVYVRQGNVFRTPLNMEIYSQGQELYDDNILFELVNKIDMSRNGEASVVLPNHMGEEYKLMLYGVKTELQDSENSLYVITYSMLSPTGPTVGILLNQLIWVSVIAIVLTLLIAFFLSRRISKPIRKIAQTAEELGKGNYNVHFEEYEYEEINYLSSTLNYATVELGKTEQMRKDFIASVSHDLRTPLTMIKAYGELIRDISGDNKEKRDKNLQVIIDESDRLSDLVTDCLDLSKLQAGTEDLKLTAVDLKEETEFVCNQFDIYRENQGYTIEAKFEGDDFLVLADKGKIHRVLYNLIGNAINYTGEDKKILLLVNSDEKGVSFFVKDTGKGIAKEDLQQIWERYNRGSHKQKKQVVSTGLGLSIVKEVLQAHKVKFGVDSELGKGSTFWFVFPKESFAKGGEITQTNKNSL